MQFDITRLSYTHTPHGLRFTAAISIDGHFAFVVKSHPGEREHTYRVVDFPRYHALRRYAWAHNVEQDFFPLERLIDRAVEAAVVRREIGDRLRTQTIFSLPHDYPGTYRALTQPCTPATRAWVLRHFPNARILNDEFIDDAA